MSSAAVSDVSEWKCNEWLRDWGAAAHADERRSLLRTVLLDTLCRCCRTSTAETVLFSPVNLIRALHEQLAAQSSTVSLPQSAETVPSGCRDDFESMELPLTPVPSQPHDSDERTLPIHAVFRSIVKSDVDAMLLQLAIGDQRGDVDEIHSSARILLQTDLMHRLDWTEPLPPPSKCAPASSSGVVECFYVPDVHWMRHGVERGFELLHEPAAPFDVIFFSLKPDNAVQPQVSISRFRALLRIGVSISTFSAGEQRSLLVDVRLRGDAAVERMVTFIADALKSIETTARVCLTTRSERPNRKRRRTAEKDAAPSHIVTDAVAAPSEVCDGEAAEIPVTRDPPTAQDDEDLPLWARYAGGGAMASAPRGPCLRSIDIAATDVGTDVNLKDDKRHSRKGAKLAVAATTPTLGQRCSALIVEIDGVDAVNNAPKCASLRQLFAEWCAPQLCRAIDDPVAPPQRLIILLCTDDSLFNDALLRWCEVPYEEHSMIPAVFCVSDARWYREDSTTTSAALCSSPPLPSPPAYNAQRKGHYAKPPMIVHCEDEGPPRTRSLEEMLHDSEISINSTTCQRVHNLLQLTGEQFGVEWSSSLVLTSSVEAEQVCLRYCVGTNKKRCGHIPYLQWRLDLQAVAHNIPRHILRVDSTDVDAVRQLHVDERERRRKAILSDDRGYLGVTRIRSGMLAKPLNELTERPRRPEVAIQASGGVRLGVVRPPVTSASARAGSAAQTVRLVRLTPAEKRTLFGAVRRIFSREFRVAVDVVQKYRIAETSRRSRPYFAGFCALFLAFKHVKLCSILRLNLFCEVELNMQSLAQAQALMERGESNEGDVVEALLGLLLPKFKCTCKPRVGEPSVRYSAASGRKLCRHIVQMVYKFMLDFTTDSIPLCTRENTAIVPLDIPTARVAATKAMTPVDHGYAVTAAHVDVAQTVQPPVPRHENVKDKRQAKRILMAGAIGGTGDGGTEDLCSLKSKKATALGQQDVATGDKGRHTTKKPVIVDFAAQLLLSKGS